MESSSGQPCDICGHVGFADCLATCNSCQKSHEHIYCMQESLDDLPEKWSCEECLRGDVKACQSGIVNQQNRKSNSLIPSKSVHCNTVGPSSFSIKGGVQVSSKNQNASNGTFKRAAEPLHTNRVSKKVKACKVKFLPTAEVCKLFSKMKRSSSFRGASGSGTLPLNTSSRRTPTTTVSSAPKSFRRRIPTPGLLGLDNLAAPKEAIKAFIPPKEVEVSKSQITSIFSDELKNEPAIEPVWKGSFEIRDKISPLELYDRFQAHIPIKVSGKGYNISKEMPGKMQFRLHHRSDVWPKMFHKNPPTTDDVSLFFFPADDNSSGQKYGILMDLMEKNDFVITSCLGSVELMVLTSKQLQVDYQRFDMKFYLWGVFRVHVSGIPLIIDQHESRVALLETRNKLDLLNSINGNDNTDLKIEIDTLGDLNAGKLDKVMMQKTGVKKVRFKLDIDEGKLTTANALQNGNGNNFAVIETSRTSVPQTCREVKELSDDLEFPPGFARPFTSNATVHGDPNKPDCGVPPGFAVKNDSSAVIHATKESLVVNESNLSPSKMMDKSFKFFSSGTSMGLSVLSPKPIKAVNLFETTSRHHQVEPSWQVEPSGSPSLPNEKDRNQRRTINGKLRGISPNSRVVNDPRGNGRGESLGEMNHGTKDHENFHTNSSNHRESNDTRLLILPLSYSEFLRYSTLTKDRR